MILRRFAPVVLIATLVGASLVGVAAADSGGASTSRRVPPIVVPPDQPGEQHLHYEVGPIHIRAGQNNISYTGSQIPRPAEAGWVVGIRPNLHLPDGTVPPVDVIHLHHGVWLNLSHADPTSPGLPERFYAAGEEKTALQFPGGYGYHYRPTDQWMINYMIHDLVDRPFDLWITYDIAFVPTSSGQTLTDAAPIWMDVQNGSVYPVFDVHRGSGHDGVFTYPDDAATDPYQGGPKLDTWTVPSDGVLIGTGGHLHPGGLHDDLWVDRAGSSRTRTRHLFSSVAHYYEPAGAVSWDVAMTVTNADWRPQLRAGDTLRVSTSYDSARASWYETMGIMIAWFVPNRTGTDPFQGDIDWRRGHLTHGHLPENDNHGGGFDPDLPDTRTLPDGPLTRLVGISDYEYGPLDMDLTTSVPTITAGDTITFGNTDAPLAGDGTWHSITACAAPCNKSTGVAYPLADGPIEIDSGQLGNYGPPTSGKIVWATPANLPKGTYTFFCRVHPFMRGAFRVVGAGGHGHPHH
ncbi:MAG: cupredoxin domain-containing protein [Acidimicrobiia bacterium]